MHDLPPYVVSSEKISVSDLEANVRTAVGNLPAECQKLYANVAGGNIVLNTPDFPDFETAIQHSVNNEGFIGHNLLVKEATEHKMEFAGTYLRITIGFAEVRIQSSMLHAKLMMEFLCPRATLLESRTCWKFGLWVIIAPSTTTVTPSPSSRCVPLQYHNLLRSHLHL